MHSPHFHWLDWGSRYLSHIVEHVSWMCPMFRNKTKGMSWMMTRPGPHLITVVKNWRTCTHEGRKKKMFSTTVKLHLLNNIASTTNKSSFAPFSKMVFCVCASMVIFSVMQLLQTVEGETYKCITSSALNTHHQFHCCYTNRDPNCQNICIENKRVCDGKVHQTKVWHSNTNKRS